MPEWSLSDPMLRTYPALAHDRVALGYLAPGKFASLGGVFAWSRMNTRGSTILTALRKC